MKKLLALLLVAAMLLSIVSCTASQNSQTAATTLDELSTDETTEVQTTDGDLTEESIPVETTPEEIILQEPPYVEIDGVSKRKLTTVSIVTNQDTVELTAGFELLRHLEIKGLTWDPNGFPIELFIDSSLGNDAYRIEGKANVCQEQQGEEYLRIIGGNGRGVIYGVVRFLEEFAGTRFFTYELETHTSDPVLLPQSILIEYQPVFEYRRTSWDCILKDPFFFVKSGMNGSHGGVTEEMGGGLYYPPDRGVHTLGYFTETGYAHPLYATNPCLTDPKNLELVIKHVRKILEENPDVNIVSVSQTDSIYYCKCQNCQAVDEEEGSPAGLMLRFVNAVAADIAEQYPNVIVSTLAYKYTRQAPKITKPRENVCVRLCSIECHFNHPLTTENCETCSAFRKDIEDWSEICDNLYIWDYTTNFRYYISYFPNLFTIRENMQFYADHNVKGMFCQGNSQGPSGEFGELRAYLLAKLMMYPYMTEEEYSNHINEFLAAYYGEGWQNIRAYIDTVSEMAHAGKGQIIYDHPFTAINKTLYAQIEPTIHEWWQAAIDAAGDRREYVERSYLHVRHAQLMVSPNEEQALSLIDDAKRFGVAWRESYRYVNTDASDLSQSPDKWVFR